MKKSLGSTILFSIGLVISGCNVLAADNMPKINEEDREKFPITIEICKKYLARPKSDSPPLGAISLGPGEGLLATLNEEGSDIVDMTIKTTPVIAGIYGGIPHLDHIPKERIARMLLPKILMAYDRQLSKDRTKLKEQKAQELWWPGYLRYIVFGSHPEVDACEPEMLKGIYRPLDNGAQCCIFKEDLTSHAELQCNVAIPTRIYKALKIKIMPSRQGSILAIPMSAYNSVCEYHERSLLEKEESTSALRDESSPEVRLSNIQGDRKGRPFKVEACSPAEKNMCFTLLKALIQNGESTIQENEDQVSIEFNIPLSQALEGYTQDNVAQEIKLHGDTGLPSDKVAHICKNDASATATWFFWQHLHRKKVASGQYFFGEDGEDGELFLRHASDIGVAGSCSLSKKEFEALQKL